MARVTLRFFGELNAFLQRRHRDLAIAHEFDGRASVKDRIEAHGVPHTEIGAIRIGGNAVGFDRRVRDGDSVEVFPDPSAVSASLPLRPPHPRGRFILDQHLGRLAAYLRLLGQDVLHRPQWSDDELARAAAEEGRVLLSRDIRLLMRRRVVHGGFIHATDPKAQVREVLRRFPAPETIAPFSRCMACNARIAEVAKADVADRLPPDTRQFYDRFWQCRACGRVYWEGSHVRRMRGWVEAWLADAR